MTIKTNAEGKVILTISANIDQEGMIIVDNVPKTEPGYDLYFNGTEFYQEPNPNYEKQLERVKLQSELQGILTWMAETDYIPNKIIRGNWEETDPRWISYLEQYAEKHTRKEEIEALLK